jgi:hypothetical protein
MTQTGGCSAKGKAQFYIVLYACETLCLFLKKEDFFISPTGAEVKKMLIIHPLLLTPSWRSHRDKFTCYILHYILSEQ